MNNNDRRKKDKAWRANSSVRDRKTHSDDADEDDGEMLRIQGLIRCSQCLITYPYHFENCPKCNHPTT